MGSLLVKRFREQAEKAGKKENYRQEAQQLVLYPTGFMNFDFMNGIKVRVKTEIKDYTYYMGGVPDGVVVLCIGRSGSGKTTFVLQSASNIARQFENSAIYHYDVEASTSEQRFKQLSGWTNEEIKDKYVHYNEGVSGEFFYEDIKRVHDLKVNNPEDFLYDTGYEDPMGNPIIKMQPTIAICDSVAMLMPEKFTEEEQLSGQMSAAAGARMNSSVFKRLIPLLKRANIILFCINHINQKIEINPMMHTKGQLSYLKQGEELPGGRTVNYLSRILIRFDDDTKFKENEGYGIIGNMVHLQLVKSNVAAAGKIADLVFNQDYGFLKTLSLFNFLKTAGRINGAGAHLYIDDHSDIKFSQKEFVDKLSNSKELQEYFNIALSEELANLPQNFIEDAPQKFTYDPNPGIMSMMNAGLSKTG